LRPMTEEQIATLQVGAGFSLVRVLHNQPNTRSVANG
jgi:hypothetical protein